MEQAARPVEPNLAMHMTTMLRVCVTIMGAGFTGPHGVGRKAPHNEQVSEDEADEVLGAGAGVGVLRFLGAMDLQCRFVIDL